MTPQLFWIVVAALAALFVAPAVNAQVDMAEIEANALAKMLGCYKDQADNRVVKNRVEFSNKMTLEMCFTTCLGNKYYAVQYGQECWCEADDLDINTLTTSDECNMQCAGNTEELNLSGVDICGGEWAFNLWEYTPAK